MTIALSRFTCLLVWHSIGCVRIQFVSFEDVGDAANGTQPRNSPAGARGGEAWRRHDNTVRPHNSSGYRPSAPETFAPTTLPGPRTKEMAMPGIPNERSMRTADEGRLILVRSALVRHDTPPSIGRCARKRELRPDRFRGSKANNEALGNHARSRGVTQGISPAAAFWVLSG